MNVIEEVEEASVLVLDLGLKSLRTGPENTWHPNMP